MVIEGWMISLGIAVVGMVGTFATVKGKVNSLSKRQEKMVDKIDEHSEVLAEHKVQIQLAPTKEFVDNKFVTKEMFQQMEKHMEEHFVSMTTAIRDLSDSIKGNHPCRRRDD